MVFERDEVSSVAGSPPFDEASETAAAGAKRVGCTNPVSCREAVFVDQSAQAISARDVAWSG